MCSACFFTAYSENSIIANKRGNSFNLGLLEKINNCLMLEKLNPARISEIYESLIDFVPWYRQNVPLSFRKSLIITIYNLHKEIWYCKSDTQNLSKQKDRRKVRRPVISTQLLWSIDISRIFFANENPRKFVEKQNMIFFYIFHVYLDKRGRLPKERLPQKTIAQGEFWPRKFSPRRLLSRKTLFAKETLFFSKKTSTSLEPLCNKEHPMTKHVVWGRVLTKQKSDTWGLF